MSGMRLVNRLLAVLAALAVIAVGVLIPVEIVRAAFGTETLAAAVGVLDRGPDP